MVPTYSQCGGLNVNAEELCCAAGDICVPMGNNYSQCRPDTTVTEPPAAGGTCEQQIQPHGKCGGRDRNYEGTCCTAGYTCVFRDIWYSQCIDSSLLSRRLLR